MEEKGDVIVIETRAYQYRETESFKECQALEQYCEYQPHTFMKRLSHPQY